MTMPKKILVVDDETGIRYLLWDVLSSNGFEAVSYTHLRAHET